MPKRKCAPCDSLPNPPIPLNSLDAALDLLVCDTFTRLEQLATKFESCANVKLEDGVVKKRFDEAIKRYWVMKSMDELCCGAKKEAARPREADRMDEDKSNVNDTEIRNDTGRPLPRKPHPGVAVSHSLTPDEEQDWRRWTPKTGDVVLVETADDGFWPGKIIDKKVFYQGRTVPRGNHFFPVRIYSEEILPTITIKSRLLPLHIRPTPPIMASPALLSAYHHAASPTTFDMLASARESLAAHQRTHPGVGDEPDRLTIKAEKEAWNQIVNWVMNERRTEKLRAVCEEREKQLRMVTKPNGRSECPEADGCRSDAAESVAEIAGVFGFQKKRRTLGSEETNAEDSAFQTTSANSIFGPALTPNGRGPMTPQRVSSPSLASFIRPALSTPQRPSSPRRTSREKRRTGIFTGVGEYSPRGHRGGTYTPPRILASGDETAPRSAGSPAPTLQKFDFVSPLGPVRMGQLATGQPDRIGSPIMLGKVGRSGSLEAVKEEEGEEDGWTVVQKKGRRRAGSEPLGEKKDMKLGETSSDMRNGGEEMMDM